jgi:hypothetical protein
MKTVQVNVKEVWDHSIEIEVPDNATRDEIVDAAQRVISGEESAITDTTEYNRTMDSDMWTVRDGDREYRLMDCKQIPFFWRSMWLRN